VSSSRAPSVSFALDVTAIPPKALPPPEPPPTVDMEDVLASVPQEDRSAFALRMIEDDVLDSTPRRPRDMIAPATRIIFPTTTPPGPPPITRRALVEYNIPLDKARRTPHVYFPQGSIMDPGLLVRPASPTTPFEFPFDIPHDTPPTGFRDYVPHEDTMDSVTRVVGLPRVFGLKGDEQSYAKVTRAAIPMDAIDNPSLMDGGANICITGVLSLLVDVVSIPPLPISVATKFGSISLDDC
jgi:hypothetical protein